MHGKRITKTEMEFWICDFCFRRIPEDDTPVPKHVDAILITNNVTRFVVYCILSSAFIGHYTERFVVKGMNNSCFLVSLWLPTLSSRDTFLPFIYYLAF
jgi:hypothetical protein